MRSLPSLPYIVSEPLSSGLAAGPPTTCTFSRVIVRTSSPVFGSICHRPPLSGRSIVALSPAITSPWSPPYISSAPSQMVPSTVPPIMSS